MLIKILMNKKSSSKDHQNSLNNSKITKVLLLDYSHLKLSWLLTTPMIVLIAYLWFVSKLNHKVIGLTFACLFSIIEYTWTGNSIQLDNGEVIFKPFDPQCKPHTVKFYNFYFFRL